MANKQAEKLITAIKKDYLKEIIKKIEELDIDKKDYIVEKLKEEKPKKKRNAPKIPLNKQCTKETASKGKCTVAACYNHICWAHMNKTQRNEYRLLKSVDIKTI
jgi:hypothetical protein|uniref:DNA-binding protein TRF1 n=1 Tax=Kluyveromyces lactis (strain ATCC 8585 / CBS 2359 / DSM 70799 / NBRC 1267 / NRRL Y-1140 / WM37) TaxID=284590 RepID=TRF1_KLULA|nr:RecName: Full=DNA-binding protein TRF1; AltName: Full=Terminal region recognition factor 1 [Kluyveromyces lactis NRRL Y-1140]AAB20739.1 terminal region recognition factor 1, TRF1=ORF10 gene product [yeast plasmid pGKl2, Peptide Plasmid, 103 aa] [yeast plasmid pGKl2]CAA30611.1 unnamed protein product [Kluyveromyces lactis]CAA30767.1 unnamed protein product [Kluyveromyces lactis]